MCVHVYCADGLPNEALVWAESRDRHILVYADSSLACAGRLTADGAAAVNRALAALPGAPSLDSATACQ